ncbi:MAG: MerR family transcriptional regulator [Roseburia sp.]|nr:MerR family transcriptional regulator [Roseburia sp.]
MKINEVEAAVGITKKNIRYYEQEGLLTPLRNKENGYRDYAKEDVETLLKIKLLRKLSIPIEEIRLIQGKRLSLKEALERHLIVLGHEEKNLQEIGRLCRLLLDEETGYETIDPQEYLNHTFEMEEKGVRFMDFTEIDRKKKRNSIGSGLAFIAFMVFLEAFMFWALTQESQASGAPPWWFAVVVLMIPILVIGGVIVVMRERIKEIDGGEEHEASKY